VSRSSAANPAASAARPAARAARPAAPRSPAPAPGPASPGRALAALCCAPLLREPLTADQADDLSRVMKALADPTRLRLVSMVAAHDGGEACVCDLTVPLGLTQPTISHHLKILMQAGLLRRQKRGVWAYYSLVPAALDAVAAVLRPAPAS
jgi:ArsR family transcriptional regulator, arsenate/arsenite/antimonite-responsive transcriptional repressor